MKHLAGKMRTARRLSTEVRRVAWFSLVWIPVAGVFLRVLGVHRLQRVVSRSADTSRAPRESAPPELRREAVTTGYRIALRNLPYRGSCLSRSIVLREIARAWGLDAQICIGVRKGLDCPEAHAWVQLDGEDLGDDGAASTDFKRMTGQHGTGWLQGQVTQQAGMGWKTS